MANISNVNNYEVITSEDSSDESLYYSASSSPDLSSYEELSNYDYLSETDSSSLYSGTYEPVIEQPNPPFYLAPAYWMEVLGIFPTEFGGTTYYQPLFYYVPVYDNLYSPLPSDRDQEECEIESTEYCSSDSNLYCPLSSDRDQEECEIQSTEYCSSDSDTELSSLSYDTYDTAEESESYFDPEKFNCKVEEFDYLNDTNLEYLNFEYSANDAFETSQDKEYLASESLRSNYDEEYRDDIELKNEVNIKTRKTQCLSNYESDTDNDQCGSENSSSICDEMEYKDILSKIDNSFETEEWENLLDFNSESNSNSQDVSSGNSERSCDDVGFEDNTLSKRTFDNSVKGSSVDNIKNDKADKYSPLSIRGISERRDVSEKVSMNAFEFGFVNNKDGHNQGLKKCNTFEDLSNAEPNQHLKKIDSLENLSQFDDNETYERDFQSESSEAETDDFECNIESLPFDPDDFEFSEEEVKYNKDEIYRRALSGKLYQKPYIPQVAVLPTIYEDECFGKNDDPQANSQTSCLTEQQGLFNGSLCNLYETSSENGEASEESQQKPKKKRMKRLREFLARMFCCVKPP